MPLTALTTAHTETMTPLPTTRCTCHAPHPDPAKPFEPCGYPLGDVPGDVQFITTSDRMPPAPDGTVWLRCDRAGCKKWNRFRIVAPRGRRLTRTP